MAIALDTAVDGGLFVNATAGSPISYAHTCTGSNGIIFVFVNTGNPADITSVTYGGDALAHIVDSTGASGTNKMCAWYKVGPKTGANNVVVTPNTTFTAAAMSASYTGAGQTGQPDNSTTNVGSSVTSLTTNLTVGTNCWTVLATAQNTGQPSAGTGSTQRISNATTGNGLYDSNAAVTGATSMAVSLGGTRNITAAMISFGPPGATPTLVTRKQLLGVGI